MRIKQLDNQQRGSRSKQPDNRHSAPASQLPKEIISHRQLSGMITTIVLGGGLLVLPKEILNILHRDAWFAFFIPILFIFLIAHIYKTLSAKYPGRNLYAINEQLFGRWGGKGINIVFLMIFGMSLVRDLFTISSFMQSTLLLRTPFEILNLLFFILIMYYGSISIEELVRINGMILPMTVILILLLPLFLLNEISFQFIQPILMSEPRQMLFGNMAYLGLYGDMMMIGVFLHTVSDHHRTESAIRYGGVISSIFLCLLLVLSTLVFGEVLAHRFLFPNYNLVQQIHVTDFLDRVDLVVFSIWLPLILMKVAFAYKAILIGWTQLTEQSHSRYDNKGLALVLLLLTLFSFGNVSKAYSTSHYSSIFNSIFVMFPLLVLIYVRARLSRSGSKQKKTKQSYSYWLGWGALILIGGMLFTGTWLDMPTPWMGNMIGLLYAFFLLFLALCTYMEVMKADPQSQQKKNPSA
ncbi:GerAB/ArcD/ProY family transporter [Marinicrinis sediminis]|uniref:Endospore germination permease n=1 Tax=Marinicrinis sediminis TaxID=1652465 RepID=A0ABW5R7Y6_9BACL